MKIGKLKIQSLVTGPMWVLTENYKYAIFKYTCWFLFSYNKKILLHFRLTIPLWIRRSGLSNRCIESLKKACDRSRYIR